MRKNVYRRLMQYDEFLGKMKGIKGVGFVKTHRAGDTGIGKTLEDLLGIAENNIAGPNFRGYELKSSRKDSDTMLTLFTKAPMPGKANAKLLEVFGYRQRKTSKDYKQLSLNIVEINGSKIPIEEKELHVTVDSIKSNSVGLKLEIKRDRLYIGNNKGVEAYYNKDTLRKAFEKKYHDLIYVLAEHKKEEGQEYFWFNEVYRLKGFSFKRFLLLVREGRLKVDIRIGHYPDGRIHDHGTGFRILPKYLPLCFEKIERIF